MNENEDGLSQITYNGSTCKLSFDEGTWIDFGHVGVMFFEFNAPDLFVENQTHVVGSHIISVVLFGIAIISRSI